jgi:hypothetical protein
MQWLGGKVLASGSKNRADDGNGPEALSLSKAPKLMQPDWRTAAKISARSYSLVHCGRGRAMIHLQ